MNTRARVKAVPALLAASIGLSSFGTIAEVLAHEGHKAAKLQPTGFEEITLTIEESGVTGMPESIEAGRYLVKVTGPEMGEMGPSGFVIAQLPEGLTAEQALDDVLSATEGAPAWYLETHWGGGASIVEGTEAWVILDLTPGTWHVSTLFGSTLPVQFEVTGEFPEDAMAPEATVELDMFEMDFKVLSGEFVAGENLVTVHNSGAQIHFAEVLSLPDGTTEEQVEGLFNSYMTGTPEPDMLNEADTMPVFYAPDQSPGVSMTFPLNLEAGTYLFTCWVQDPETGMPHAMMGMHELITVE